MLIILTCARIARASSKPRASSCFSRSRPLSLIAMTRNSCPANNDDDDDDVSVGSAVPPGGSEDESGSTVPIESTGSFSLPFFLSQACQALTSGLGYGPWQMAT